MWEWLCDALFPRRCLVCRREGEWLCGDHATFFDAPPDQSGVTETDDIFAAVAYDSDSARAVVEQFKFRGTAELAELIGAEIEGRLPDDFLRNSVLVPVPLHWSRLWWRGYNQAKRMAVEIGKRTDIPVSTDLRRVRRTRQQAKLSREQRLKNLSGAFRWEGAVPARVVLVDDVVASGSTIAECARVMREAGALSVSAVVFARGGKISQ